MRGPLKTGAISYIMPEETLVAVVRLDNKVVGKIVGTVVNGDLAYRYVPSGWGKGRRRELPLYNTLRACRRALETPDTVTQSPVREPETVAAG